MIDESLDIMLWALQLNDPRDLLFSRENDGLIKMLALIKCNDNEFVDALKKYKAAARYHDDNILSHRQQCESFIHYLEERLTKYNFIKNITPDLIGELNPKDYFPYIYYEFDTDKTDERKQLESTYS